MCLVTLVLFFSLTIFQHHINENSDKEVAEEAGKTLRSVLQNATQLQHQSSADLQQGFNSLALSDLRDDEHDGTDGAFHFGG